MNDEPVQPLSGGDELTDEARRAVQAVLDSPTAPMSAARAPSLSTRIAAVWFRHWKVYSNTFVANATPAVFEPILFMLAVGLGLGRFIDQRFLGLSYPAFMAPGILAMTAMYTAAFEASYSCFIRLRFQKAYEGMLATPLTRMDIFVGELLWCGTKGMLFAAIVGAVLALFGTIGSPWALLIPAAGFVTALCFGGFSFIVTSYVKNINHFQFYFTAGLTPLVFFSGLTFPVDTLPAPLPQIAYSLPMFHVIETFRLITWGPEHLSAPWAWISPLVVLGFTGLFSAVGVARMVGRLRA